jgi:hypothetical protein
MQPKATGLLHDAHKNRTHLLRLLQNKKIARWVLCFEAKSTTEKFDEADTAQSENDIRFSAICHADTPVYNMHTAE